MSESNKPEAWEKDMIKDLFFTIHKEQAKDRRWRRGIQLIRSLGFVLMIVAFLTVASTSGRLPWQTSKADSPHIAFINIKGEIAAGSLADEDHLIPSIQAAFKNPHAKAIVLRINSPGGSPVQAGRIYEEVKAQKAEYPEKQVLAVIDDIGASGGYYIAVAADKIYADKASMVGSIGVISSGFGFTGLMENLGIERRVITSGESKALLDPFSPLSEEITSFWKDVLSKTHQQFIERVKESRGERLRADSKVFSGLIWNGEQALEIGLIDGLGSLHSISRNILEETNLVDYSPSEDIVRRLTQRTRMEASTIINELSTVKVY